MGKGGGGWPLAKSSASLHSQSEARPVQGPSGQADRPTGWKVSNAGLFSRWWQGALDFRGAKGSNGTVLTRRNRVLLRPRRQRSRRWNSQGVMPMQAAPHPWLRSAASAATDHIGLRPARLDCDVLRHGPSPRGDTIRQLSLPRSRSVAGFLNSVSVDASANMTLHRSPSFCARARKAAVPPRSSRRQRDSV
jgi:hypothetical protein